MENSCKGRSRRDIEQRLYRRGIDKSIICDVLDELRPGSGDDIEAVWSALRKKSVTRDNIAELDYNRKGRLYAYLMRKGFSAEVIGRVLHCEG